MGPWENQVGYLHIEKSLRSGCGKEWEAKELDHYPEIQFLLLTCGVGLDQLLSDWSYTEYSKINSYTAKREFCSLKKKKLGKH